MTEELLPKPRLQMPEHSDGGQDFPLPRPPATEAAGNVGQAEKEIPAHTTQDAKPVNLTEKLSSMRTPAHPFPRFLSKRLAIVALILFAVIFVGLGIFNFIEQKNLSAISDFESCVAAGNPVMESYPATCRLSDGRSFTQVLSGEEQKNLNPNPTEDWQTYEGGGFSFEYPADFVIENNNSIINIKPNSSVTEKDPSKYFTIGISIESLSKNSDLLSFIKSKQYITLGKSREKIFKDEDIKPYTANELNGYYWFGGFEYMGYHIYFENNGKVYIFTFNKDEAGIFPEPQKTELNELDQILSTFKFTEFTDATGRICGDEYLMADGGNPCPSGYMCKFKGEYPNTVGTCEKQ